MTLESHEISREALDRSPQPLTGPSDLTTWASWVQRNQLQIPDPNPI